MQGAAIGTRWCLFYTYARFALLFLCTNASVFRNTSISVSSCLIMNVIVTFNGRVHIGNPDVSHRSFTSHSMFPLSLRIMFHPCVFCFCRVDCLLISGRNHTVCGIIYWGKYFCIYHVIGDILKMSSSSSVSMPIVLPVPVCFCVHSTPGSVEVCMDQSTHQGVG